MFTKFRMPSKFIVPLVLLTISISVAFTTVYANYIAFDDAQDNPDGLIWWFAPHSLTHRGALWDGQNPYYTVVDAYLKWRSDVGFWWANQPDRNYVHETRVSFEGLEAISWYWTSLPPANHVEDSTYAEEIADGYEEMELGWDTPATQIPGGINQFIQT